MDILIIDDEERVRRGLRKLLDGHQGWRVVADCAAAGEALAFLQKSSADVIITDIRMPGASGLDLIQDLRQQGRGVPIVILSGYADFQYAQRAIELGVIKYLTKPTNTRELVSFLEQLEDSLRGDREGSEVSNLLVSRAISFLEEHYSEKISLREVAQALYISPNYLSDLFRRHTGRTLSDYLLHLRMERARAYLADVHYRVSDIARLVGFSDSRYFSSTFKRMYGMRPLDFRNSARQPDRQEDQGGPAPGGDGA